MIFVEKKIMIITLLGYMGSGKSTIGSKIQQVLNKEFIDLDEYITQQESKEISQIFQDKGEVYFRGLEHKYLQELLLGDNFILSLGGGTPVYYNNMDLINEKSISFYLRMSPTELTRRLINGKETRPLIAHLDDSEIQEFIAKHLFERSVYYEQAKFKINNNSISEEEASQQILAILEGL